MNKIKLTGQFPSLTFDLSSNQLMKVQIFQKVGQGA